MNNKIYTIEEIQKLFLRLPLITALKGSFYLVLMLAEKQPPTAILIFV